MLGAGGKRNRRGFDAHHVGEKPSAHGSREVNQRGALALAGPRVHDHHGFSRIGIMERVAERRMRLDDGHNAETAELRPLPSAFADRPAENGLVAGEVFLRVREAGAGVHIGAAHFDVVPFDGGARGLSREHRPHKRH